MSFEIVYTSASRGLKEGTRGFCTVAATAGIPTVLHQKLESLSGYRHAFKPDSPDNPVNYSYLIVPVNRERYYVLSRVADAGTDFSGRSNKIAHHLAFAASERPQGASGPAALLMDSSFWFEEWDREPQQLAAARVPRGGSGNSRAATWQDAFGDAGWAGMLAREAEKPTGPVYVIVPAGTDALDLASEAMQLLPSALRWKTSFSTYYTKLPSNIDCQWRFVLDASTEARRLRARPSGRLIDPLESGDPAADDSYVIAARAGKVVADSAAPARPRRNVATRKSAAGATASTASRRAITKSQIRRKQAGTRARNARLGISNEKEQEYEDDYGPAEPLTRNAPVRQQRSKGLWLIVGGVVLVAAVAGFFALRQSGTDELPNDDVEVTDDTDAAPSKADDDEGAVVDVKAVKKSPKKVDKVKPPPTKAAAVKNRPKQRPVVPKIAAPQRDPFAEIKKRENRLPLPSADAAEQTLVALPVPARQDCILALIGGASILPKAKLVIEPDGSDPVRAWTVIKRAVDPIFGESDAGVVAHFRIDDDQLRFNWEKPVPGGHLLRRCLLSIQISQRKELCFLVADAEGIPPLRFRINQEKQADLIPLKFPATELPNPELIRLEWHIHKLPGDVMKKADGPFKGQLKPNQKQTISLTTDPKSSNKKREIELQYVISGASGYVRTRENSNDPEHLLKATAFVYDGDKRIRFQKMEKPGQADGWADHVKFFRSVNGPTRIQINLYYQLPDHPGVRIHLVRSNTK